MGVSIWVCMCTCVSVLYIGKLCGVCVLCKHVCVLYLKRNNENGTHSSQMHTHTYTHTLISLSLSITHTGCIKTFKGIGEETRRKGEETCAAGYREE